MKTELKWVVYVEDQHGNWKPDSTHFSPENAQHKKKTLSDNGKKVQIIPRMSKETKSYPSCPPYPSLNWNGLL